MRKRLYAIKHTPTGGYLPEVDGRSGYTYTEPVTVDALYGAPRLFHTKGGARRALRWWLNGKLHVTTYTSTNPDSWGEIDQDWHHDPTPERKEEDMEIVTMLLQEIVVDD